MPGAYLKCPQVGSIYNEAIRDSTTQRWQSSHQRRTLQHDADHHGNTGCMAWEQIFMCILHCIMGVGRLVVQFLEAVCVELKMVLRASV